MPSGRLVCQGPTPNLGSTPYSLRILLPSLDDINFLITPPTTLAPGRVSIEPTRGSNEKGNPSMGWILVWLAHEGRCANQTWWIRGWELRLVGVHECGP